MGIFESPFKLRETNSVLKDHAAHAHPRDAHVHADSDCGARVKSPDSERQSGRPTTVHRPPLIASRIHRHWHWHIL